LCSNLLFYRWQDTGCRWDAGAGRACSNKALAAPLRLWEGRGVSAALLAVLWHGNALDNQADIAKVQHAQGLRWITYLLCLLA
jgi:hypothetical protein